MVKMQDLVLALPAGDDQLAAGAGLVAATTPRGRGKRSKVIGQGPLGALLLPRTALIPHH